MTKVAIAALAAVVLAGCSSQVSRDRATMMGVVAGAGAGAVVGAAATGTATGTAVGAAAGGVTGGILTSALTPSRCYRWTRSGRRVRTRCY
jgi:osmotically inducible lipoprotein OsmB